MVYEFAAVIGVKYLYRKGEMQAGIIQSLVDPCVSLILKRVVDCPGVFNFGNGQSIAKFALWVASVVLNEVYLP